MKPSEGQQSDHPVLQMFAQLLERIDRLEETIKILVKSNNLKYIAPTQQPKPEPENSLPEADSFDDQKNPF